MTTKVLLDTDIGSDIDDAVCLAYLLAQPECELMGITTVTGAPERRAMLASVMCKAAGRDVPIFPGRAAPLLGQQCQPEVPQASALERWPHETRFPRGEAVEFMRRTIRENPGEVVLLGIGPLTNVAGLFAADEEIAGLLKGLVLMCGVFGIEVIGQSPCEWNARCDPLATATVYAAPCEVHRSVGLDVTMQVTLDAEQARESFGRSPRLAPVLDLAEVWFDERPDLVFHDPLAAATIFEPGLCRYARGRVEIGLADERLRGFTHWQANGGPHEIAVDVDRDRFFEHYFDVFIRQPSGTRGAD